MTLKEIWSLTKYLDNPSSNEEEGEVKEKEKEKK